MSTPGPLTVEDRLLIMELLARYCWAEDSGDMEAFLECFLPDAELYMSHRAKGHDELRRWLERFSKDSAFPGSQHFASQFRITEGTSERATYRAYVARLHRIPGTTNSQIVWQGYYTDTVVKVGGKWFYELKNAHEASQLRQQEYERAPYPKAPQFYDLGATIE